MPDASSRPQAPTPKASIAVPPVTTEERTRRYGHPGLVLWLTGLSGAGKSTLCRAIERELFDRGQHVYALEGDELRHGINSNLGFSREDRQENVRRAAEVSKLLSSAGFVAIMALISPNREDRRAARRLVEQSGGKFVQIFVNASLEVCESRDVKGLYRRARAGEIQEFTGISSPYDLPMESEITLRTDLLSVQECVASVMQYLQPLLEGHERR